MGFMAHWHNTGIYSAKQDWTFCFHISFTSKLIHEVWDQNFHTCWNHRDVALWTWNMKKSTRMKSSNICPSMGFVINKNKTIPAHDKCLQKLHCSEAVIKRSVTKFPKGEFALISSKVFRAFFPTICQCIYIVRVYIVMYIYLYIGHILLWPLFVFSANTLTFLQNLHNCASIDSGIASY